MAFLGMAYLKALLKIFCVAFLVLRFDKYVFFIHLLAFGSDFVPIDRGFKGFIKKIEK